MNEKKNVFNICLVRLVALDPTLRTLVAGTETIILLHERAKQRRRSIFFQYTLRNQERNTLRVCCVCFLTSRLVLTKKNLSFLILINFCRAIFFPFLFYTLFICY